MKQALWWESLDGLKVKCTLCPNDCTINDGKSGVCGVRVNIGGVLYSATDGHYISQAVDPIEKKPLNFFHPGSMIYSVGTSGCNLRCSFCQNWQLVKQPLTVLEHYSTDDESIVQSAIDSNSIGIAFTYNEPTMNWEQMMRISKIAKEKRLVTVAVSNGYLNEEPMRELCRVIDAWNIDLKGNTAFYKRNCGGDAETVLRNIKIANENCHVEVTNLLIDGENSSDEEIETLSKSIADINPNIPIHISRYFPNYHMDIPMTEIESIKRAYSIHSKYLKNVLVGNCVI